MTPATERQKLVLWTVAKWTKAKGYPPSLRELAHVLEIRSANGVHKHVTALRRKGLLADDADHRKLVITKEGRKLL